MTEAKKARIFSNPVAALVQEWTRTVLMDLAFGPDKDATTECLETRQRFDQSIGGPPALQRHGGTGMTDELVGGHRFKSLTAIEMAFGNTDAHPQRFVQPAGEA